MPVNAMGQYIGAKVTPSFFENPSTGNNAYLPGVAYEELTLVTYNNIWYISKRHAPAGVLPTNTEYWIPYPYTDVIGDYQNQLDEIRSDLSYILVPTANLCNVETGRYYVLNGVITESSDHWVGVSDNIPCTPNTSYVFSAFDIGTTTNSKLNVQWWDASKNQLSTDSINRAGTTFHYTYTSPADASFMTMSVYNSTAISESSKLMISEGSTNPTAYVPPYTVSDDTARSQIASLAASVALTKGDIATQNWIDRNGYTSLLDLPAGVIYGISSSVSINGKPTKLQAAPFSFVSIKCRQNSLDYSVLFAIGRSAAYYALVYTNDTLPVWVNFDNPAADETLTIRWGPSAEIVLLGDSIVQGVGSSDYSATGDTIVTIDGTDFKRNVGEKSWGAKFKAHVEGSYYRLTVVNNGLPGQGIQTITNNLDNLVSANTKVAIVCAGVNNRNIGATTIQNYYIDLFNALIAKNIKVLALSAIDVNGATFNTSMALINTALERACNTCEVPYYNLFGEYNAVLNATDKADYYTDTLHPNDKGYSAMFGLICKLLNF